MIRRITRAAISALLVLATVLVPRVASAQSKKKCHILCAPAFSIWTEMHRSHLFENPRVRDLPTGTVSELPSKNNFMLLFLTSIPTEIPRLSLLFDVSWLPTAKASANPFTEYSASSLGDDITANLPAVAAGGSYAVITAPQTDGWVEVTPYIDDLFSKAAQPDDESDYTHKLELGITTTVALFSQLSKSSWLHGVKLAGNLDWVATGLPHKGDEIPRGERVFLEDAKGFTLAIGLVLPIAPIP